MSCLCVSLEVPAPALGNLGLHQVGPHLSDPGFWEYHLSSFVPSVPEVTVDLFHYNLPVTLTSFFSSFSLPNLCATEYLSYLFIYIFIFIEV